MIITPCDKKATPEVKQVLAYLNSIEGNHILTGQHTQSMPMEEVQKIKEVTGKLPAVCGFELLSYSPNINRADADAACLSEVDEAAGTLEKAYEWAEKKGLITFTWHWFSPLYGRDKSFYSDNTDFDPENALIEASPENLAMCHDMDVMAELLKGFQDKHIPILWRPFHESEGAWFWWGRKGPAIAARLFRYMFKYFTEKHDLHNLIWVWNCPLPKGYVGDDFCDIISLDMYPEPHAHGDFAPAYERLRQITETEKGTAIGETGILPDPDRLTDSHIPWLWYMTWSHDFCLTERFNTYDFLKKLYQHPYAITLESLPKLY